MPRPFVLVACSPPVREARVTAPDVERLEQFADWDWLPCEVPLARDGLYQEPVESDVLWRQPGPSLGHGPLQIHNTL